MDTLRIDTIDRKNQVYFTVNGKEIVSYQGETLLAALIANGYKITKKSPLKGNPRGALCGMGVCFECIVTVDGVPNIRSCMTEVRDKMKVEIND